MKHPYFRDDITAEDVINLHRAMKRVFLRFLQYRLLELATRKVIFDA